MDQPDMLINHDTRILQQILSTLTGKKGEGISITLLSINQVNINMDSKKFNSPDQKLLLSEGNGQKKNSGNFPIRVGLTKERLIQALEETGWNRTAAAGKLKLSYQYVCDRIRALDIKPPSGEWMKRLNK